MVFCGCLPWFLGHIVFVIFQKMMNVFDVKDECNYQNQ